MCCTKLDKRYWVAAFAAALLLLTVGAVLLQENQSKPVYTIEEPYFFSDAEVYRYFAGKGEIGVPKDILGKMTTRAILLTLTNYKGFGGLISYLQNPIPDDPYAGFRFQAESFNAVSELVAREDSIAVIKAEMSERANDELFSKPVDLRALSEEEKEVFKAFDELYMLLHPVAYFQGMNVRETCGVPDDYGVVIISRQGEEDAE